MGVEVSVCLSVCPAIGSTKAISSYSFHRSSFKFGIWTNKGMGHKIMGSEFWNFAPSQFYGGLNFKIGKKAPFSEVFRPSVGGFT